MVDLVAELGIETGMENFRGQLTSIASRQLGLRTLANGGVVGREFWESRPRNDIGFSRFQEAAQLFSESVTLPLP